MSEEVRALSIDQAKEKYESLMKSINDLINLRKALEVDSEDLVQVKREEEPCYGCNVHNVIDSAKYFINEFRTSFYAIDIKYFEYLIKHIFLNNFQMDIHKLLLTLCAQAILNYHSCNKSEYLPILSKHLGMNISPDQGITWLFKNFFLDFISSEATKSLPACENMLLLLFEIIKESRKKITKDLGNAKEQEKNIPNYLNFLNLVFFIYSGFYKGRKDIPQKLELIYSNTHRFILSEITNNEAVQIFGPNSF